MTQTKSLTYDQIEAFDRLGVLRLDGLISAERVRRARAAVLAPLARRGLWRDGAWRLDAAPKPRWPASGLKTAKVIGNKHPALAALLEEPALRAAVDVLLDGRPFDNAVYRRPQVLFTLPNADRWTLPNGWHVDCPRVASGVRPGVQLFTFLDVVEPGGGGTLAIAGSHRLLNDGRHYRLKEMTPRLRREAFFRDLYGATPSRTDLPVGAVGDVPLRVVEMTGAPGDVWLVDLRVLHSAAPNAAERPRLMATHRFFRADVMREVAEAFGWSPKDM
jgi:hypothetical protein